MQLHVCNSDDVIGGEKNHRLKAILGCTQLLHNMIKSGAPWNNKRKPLNSGSLPLLMTHGATQQDFSLYAVQIKQSIEKQILFGIFFFASVLCFMPYMYAAD